jgi:hypothetical protein
LSAKAEELRVIVVKVGSTPIPLPVNNKKGKKTNAKLIDHNS